MAAQHDHHNIHTTVSITKKVSVHSKASSHPSNILELSNLDRQCPILIYLVFFYKPCNDYQDLSIETIFNRLKTGLEDTLLDWYPAAGRLNINSEDGKVNILCNNNGAVLVEAVTQAKISELGDDLSVYNEFYENLVYKVDANYGNISEMPLVVAQVTKFSCGGYSLGIGINHSLFDGPSGCHFLSAWASKFSTRPETHNDRVLYEPMHERGRLLINKSLNNYQKMSIDDDNDVGLQTSRATVRGVAAIDHLYQLIRDASSVDRVDQDEGGYVISTFRFTAAMIQSLKKKIYGGGGDGESFPCSSFEVLAAHLWKVRTKALGLNQEKMVCLQFAVDARNKITSSPLPKGFSGNAYVLASIASTSKDLEQQSYQTLIKKINEAKNSITDDYVNEYIKSLEGPQVNLPSLQELTIVSDWTKLPYQKIDFFGEIANVAPLVPPVPQVAYFMPNPNEKGGIDVRIGLLPKTQDAFKDLFVMDL